MGVPALFRWLSKKYPRIVDSVQEEEPRTAPSGRKVKVSHGDDEEEEDEIIELPLDMSRPNPNGEEFDALYLDMNGIVHPCTHPEGKPAPETEEDMMLEVFKYTERVVNMVRPRKLLMMAIDGVAPRAKMNQQRSRRFRAAQEAKEKEEERIKALEEWKAMGIPISDEAAKGKKAWDSNAITPGTPFMDLLAASLRYWVAKKMKEDAGWKKLQVIISDASVPGEGEHKIMDFIRRQRANSDHDPNTKHVIYGLDADLIMLSLATHEPHFKVLREDVFAQDAKARGCHKCGREGHIAANCIGEPKEKSGKNDEIAQKKPERKPFIFLDVGILREYLDVELDVPGLPFAFDLERAIDDWVFLIFFVGNDFLPHLPSLEIREGAIDNLLRIWKSELPRMGGYLTKHGQVELKNAELILHGIAVMEDDIFRRRKEAEERQDANQKRRKIEDENRQRADMEREALKRGETDYVAVKPSRQEVAPADGPDYKAQAIAALSSGDPGKVIDNQKAIRMANLSAAERLKAELAGKAAQARKSLGDAGEEVKKVEAEAEAETGASKPVAVVKKEGKVEAADGDATDGASVKVEKKEEEPSVAAGEDSALFKMDEETDPSAGAEAAPKRARKRAIEEVEGNVTAEGDEEEEDDAEEKVIVDDDEPDIVALTNIERKVNPDGTVEYEDTVKLWEPGYRERYYRQKFGVELSDTSFRRELVKSYVEGLCWVLAYYYQGCPSWTWFYPYHFSPFAADFTELDTLEIRFDLGKPFRPYDQLMGVLPAASRASIPPTFHPLMLSEDSEIIDFYPSDFQIDMNGKKMAWQGVALLPFIDEKRLLDALEKRYGELNEDERRRNAFGDNSLLVAEEHDVYDSLCSLYAKRKTSEPLELDTKLSGGISGFVRPDPGFVPGTTYDSPLEKVGEMDLLDNRSLTVIYDFPPQKTPHRSVLLKGAKPRTRVLTAEEREITRRGGPSGRGGRDGARGRGRGRGGGYHNGGDRNSGAFRMGAGPMGGGGGGGSYGASPASQGAAWGGNGSAASASYGASAYGGGSYGGGGGGGGYGGNGGYANGHGGTYGADPYGAVGGGGGGYGGYGSGAGGYGGASSYAAAAPSPAQVDPYANYAQSRGFAPLGGGGGGAPQYQGYGGYGGSGGYGAQQQQQTQGAAYGGGAGAYGGSSYGGYGGYGQQAGAYGGAAAGGYGGTGGAGAYGAYGAGGGGGGGYGGYGAQSHHQQQQQSYGGAYGQGAQRGPPSASGGGGRGAPPPLGLRGGARGGRGGAGPGGGPYGR